MDTFTIIQNFFTRMPCQFCGENFEQNDVSLVGEGDGYFIVSISCHSCGTHNGTAAVGVEVQEELLDAIKEDQVFQDPELTEEDLERLQQFEPIAEDDVLSAHEFIQKLDGNWLKFIPPEIRERCTEPDNQ